MSLALGTVRVGLALAIVGPLAAAQVEVRSTQKVSETSGSFGGTLAPSCNFGVSVASLGDLDGDGIGDLAVGASGDHDGGSLRGAVWILFLDADGSVRSEQKISDTAGGFGGVLDNGDSFGVSLSSPGDLDGDGVAELAVGAYQDDDGGTDRGAVWILFLEADGSVASEQKISATAGGFAGVLDDSDYFGRSVGSPGDLDGDGLDELAVGAFADDDGGSERGAVWILFLDADGTVRAEQKISASAGGLAGPLDDGDLFGASLGSPGDLDGDGLDELAVGALADDDGGSERGAAWILFLDADGTVRSEQKISASAGGFGGLLEDGDGFGGSVSGTGDLDGDGIGDLAVGSALDDDGGAQQGALWILFLETDGSVRSQEKVSATAGGFGGDLDPGDFLGFSVSRPGDLDGDGLGELAIGAAGDDDGGAEQGAVWITFLQQETRPRRAPWLGSLPLVWLPAPVFLPSTADRTGPRLGRPQGVSSRRVGR